MDNEIEPDALEQMAFDLEDAQQNRFKKIRGRRKNYDEKEFWNDRETCVFETIELFLQKSRTFKINKEDPE